MNDPNLVRVDFAVAFGQSVRPADERTTTTLVQLFADGILIYDGVAVTSDAPDGIAITFHQGLAFADPDPTILNAQGPSTPAFRNTIYVVVQNYPISATAPALPQMRATISDVADPSNPVATPFTVVADSPINAHTIYTSRLTKSIFGIGEVDSPSHFYVIHEYSLLDDTEVRQSAIFGGPPDAIYGNHVGNNVHYRTDLGGWVVFDDENNMLLVQTGNSLSNFMPICIIDNNSGMAISHIGFEGSLPDFSDPLNPSIEVSHYGVLMKYRSYGSSQYGLCTAGIFSGVHFIGYAHSAQATIAPDVPGFPPSPVDRGGRIQAGDVKLVWDGTFNLPDTVRALVSYPILERPELQALFNVQNLMFQDWVGLVATNTTIYLMQRTVVTKAAEPPATGIISVAESSLASDAEALFTLPYGSVIDLVVSPVDGAVLLLYDTAGDGSAVYMAKLAPQFQITGHGVTITGLIPIWGGTALPNYSQLGMKNSIQVSNLDSGVFMYSGNGHVYAVDLLNGRGIYDQAASPLGADTYFDWQTRSLILPFGTDDKVTRVKLTGIITAAGCALADLLRWSALRLGYTTGQITVTNIDDTVIGGIIDQPTTIRDLLTTLSQVYGFSIAEFGGAIKFVRSERGVGVGTAAIVGKEDLAPLSDYVNSLGSTATDGQSSNTIQTVIAAPDEVPADVQVMYIDPAMDYQVNTQMFRRARFPFDTVQTQRIDQYQVPLVLTASAAISSAARIAFAGYAHGIVYTWRLPHRFVYLEPSDVVTLLDKDNTPLVAQVVQVTYNQDWSLAFAGVNWDFNDHPGLAADAPLGFRPPQSHGPSDSFAIAMDMPLIDLSDNIANTVLAYEGVASYGQPDYQTATMFRQIGNGTQGALYTTAQVLNQGTTTVSLPQSGALGNTYRTDTDTVLEVFGQGLDPGGFVTLDDDLQFLAGVNAVVVGAPGRWELVFFRDVEVVDAHRVRLTTLLRGRRGTDVMTDLHQIGDRVVLVNRTGVLRKDYYPTDSLNKAIAYMAIGKVVTQPPAPTMMTLTGASHKPWAPCHVSAALVGGNDIDLAWVRRDRLGIKFVTDPVTPQVMSEEDEDYEVEIYDGMGTLKRTVTALASAALTYTSAQQTTDGLTPGSVPTLHVKVYQVSALVGRGFAADKVLNVS